MEVQKLTGQALSLQEQIGLIIWQRGVNSAEVSAIKAELIRLIGHQEKRS
jgi:hypothetical protein